MPRYPKRGLHGQVVHEIAVEILAGEIKQGDLLPNEAELEARFDASRTAIREAMKVLAAKGLIEGRPRRGTRVRPRSDWNLLDPDVLGWQNHAEPAERYLRNLIEVRAIIEPAATELAAQRCTTGDIAALEKSFREIEAGLHDNAAYIAADLMFHDSILAASHNELLQQMSHAIGAALYLSRQLTTKLPGSSAASLPFHWLVYEAIRDRNAVRAREAMRELIERTARDIDYVLQGLDNRV